MVAIETDGLTRRFGDFVAVDDLSLSVEEGEVFGFLGPNGAGKSTTISVLLGFLKPSSGTASILGHDVTTNSRAIRKRIGLLPEGYDVYENLTGREHVVSAIETKGADDDPDAILDRVGFDPDDARRPAGDYSKGMKQRMSLGVALVGDPDVLVLDEPSSGLDPKGIKLLRQIVREEVDRGATVFFSSHVLDEVEKVCDRVAIMQAGKLVTVDTVDNLRTELGAESVVEATVERSPSGISLDDVEAVTDVTVDGRTVRATCARPTAKMRALRRIDDRATVTDISIEEASLEALFERYTTGDDGAADYAPTAESPEANVRAAVGTGGDAE
ncbi:ABC transporter ATP-binding protein [Halomicrococcus sp. NG-SE-24]|uniref:ABC transporter ATP-binding protein n=1 Tax=Halomicrococcus sp. NG-SE-24 TaxID=3436928 RepID=UPI003D9612EE